MFESVGGETHFQFSLSNVYLHISKIHLSHRSSDKHIRSFKIHKLHKFDFQSFALFKCSCSRASLLISLVQLGYSTNIFAVNQIIRYNGVFAVTKSPRSRTLFSVPWHFVIAGFHCTCFCVRAATPAMSAKPPGIFPSVYVRKYLVIELLIVLDTYKILSDAIHHALMTVSET